MKDSEAFLSILIVAVACDGRIRNDEAAALRKVLENRGLFADISEREMSEMTLTISENISSAGFTTVLDSAISSLSVCYHDSVVAVATYLVGVDRHLKQENIYFVSFILSSLNAKRDLIIIL